MIMNNVKYPNKPVLKQYMVWDVYANQPLQIFESRMSKRNLKRIAQWHQADYESRDYKIKLIYKELK